MIRLSIMFAPGHIARLPSTLPILIFLLIPLTLSAGDWPQYRGANHDGISTDHIVKQWTGSRTNPVWRVTGLNGLGSVAVSAGALYTLVVRSNKEMCLALSVTDGTELWATPIDSASYPNGGVGSDDGPRSTPSVDGASVYVLSSFNKLCRLRASDGAVLWTNNLCARYGGSVIPWQNAASPLVDGGLIYINGTSSSSNLLALRTEDGTLAWRSQNEAMTHSTPVMARILGVRQLIFATQSGLVSLAPESGELLWKFPYPFVYDTCLAVSPVVHQDKVFISGSYGMGSCAIQVRWTNQTWQTSQLWYRPNSGASNLASIWMTPVACAGFLYGQFGNAIKCVELQTGRDGWSTPFSSRGGNIMVDNHILVVSENGQMLLLQPNTNAYTRLAQCLAIPNIHSNTNKVWNVPAVCDGRVYVRSTAMLACFDLSTTDLHMETPPNLAGNPLQITVRAANGAPLDESRVANIVVQASPNPALPYEQWSTLTNTVVFTNGMGLLQNLDLEQSPRFFILREP